nr:hypothetical protein [Tanacetum cinerariifolium]
MGLLDFVKSPDPFKVKFGERTLAEIEVPLLTETTDMVVTPSDQTKHLVSHTISDEIREHFGKNKKKVGFSTILTPVKKARTGGVVVTELVSTTAEKSPAVIQKLITQSGKANLGSGSAAFHAKEFVSSSITPTPDHEDHEDSGLTHDGNVQTHRAFERYVILTSSSKHEDADTVEGLEAGIKHGIVGRSLVEVDAYDSRVGAAYVAAMNEFENMSFTLLEHLEALKDYPLELLMSALTLEGDHGYKDSTPEFHKLQPVYEQVTVPIYFEHGGGPFVVTLSLSSQEASLVAADHQVSSATNVDDTVPSSELHDDLFNVTVLDKLWMLSSFRLLYLCMAACGRTLMID